MRRLLSVRWSGQFTDGIFQSALASFLLFSPERQASALNAALAFALVLLPYSLVGPLAGTLLDRFSRRRAILFANLSRSLTLIFIALLISQGRTGVELTIFVLIAFGLNRLILAALSAGIPLVSPPTALIASNALAVTAGSVAVVLGGGLGLLIRRISDALTSANSADGYLIIAASAGYLLTSLFASLLKKGEIGPLPHERERATFGAGFTELREGIKFLKLYSDATRGIFAVAIHRGGITGLTLAALLLERNTFNDPQDSEAGLAGLSIALSGAAVGFVIGAIIAPRGVRWIGRHRWMRLSLFLAAIGSLILVLDRTQNLLIATAFFTGLFGQSLKVTNDALVQSKISDEYRGRTFAIYDVVVNASIVLSALGTALLLPDSGDSWLVPALIASFYFVTALVFLRPSKFFLKGDASNATTPSTLG
ncbi:MAG: MFS transporter [Actinobacteria bacterium]|nr:MFS transporter [Actinomycetota bacterium]